jgi:hypothetical protein
VTCAAKLLAYCVTDAAATVPATGVRGAPVRTINMESLNCIYSPLIPPQEFDSDDALKFHSVLNSAFEQYAIIPFRFPTLLQNETDLQNHLREKQARYLEDLRQLADLVQMEIRFRLEEKKSNSPRSGTEYLQNKQAISGELQSLAQQARAALGDMVVDWKERPTDQGLRCYALIKRQQVSDLRQRLQATRFATPKPAIVSGPWPATEFLHD